MHTQRFFLKVLSVMQLSDYKETVPIVMCNAFNIMPQTDVSYPVTSTVKSRELTRNVPHASPRETHVTKSMKKSNSDLRGISPMILTSLNSYSGYFGETQLVLHALNEDKNWPCNLKIYVNYLDIY